MYKGIDPDRALQLVLENTPQGKVSTVPIRDVLGLVLAETILADRDYPPFERSMMDGYAVRVKDAGNRVKVTSEVQAGQLPSVTIEPGTCASIMTGAPCPEGTEAVVMKEKVLIQSDSVTLPDDVRSGQNIVARGSECKEGHVALSDGAEITPLALAILASVGRQHVQAMRPPTLAIISTGNEVVDQDASPDGVQIRNSNGPMLAAMARRIGLSHPLQLHAQDILEGLAVTLDRAASAEIILLSGGVSAGQYDLVPRALQAFGATPIFHKVTQKPGKPLLFCRRGEQLIFGLPGNPLSSHFCFHRYVAPAVRRMLKRNVIDSTSQGRLVSSLDVSCERTLFLLARVEQREWQWDVRPLMGLGSADIFASSGGNAYLRLSPGRHLLEPGQEVSFEWLGERR